MNVNYINVQYLFYRLYTFLYDLFAFFSPSDTSGNAPLVPQGVVDFLILLKALAFFLSIFLFGLALYAYWRFLQIKKRTAFKFTEIVPGTERAPMADKWEEILKHVGSENASDWKLAVLEADNILDDLLQSLKIPGDTLGERLKNADPADFRTINEAWEAHKVRNKIAHEGLDFVLTKREARKAIDRYEQVFREFKLI